MRVTTGADWRSSSCAHSELIADMCPVICLSTGFITPGLFISSLVLRLLLSSFVSGGINGSRAISQDILYSVRMHRCDSMT